MKNAIFILLIAALVSACKSHKTIEQDSVTIDTVVVNHTRHDSVYIESVKHDSIYVREKGDTVLIEKWHTQYRDRWRDRLVYDSIYIAHRDTVVQTKIVEVKASLSWWQQTRLHIANILLYVLGITAIIYGVRLWIRSRM